jgi:hypothetical protein
VGKAIIEPLAPVVRRIAVSKRWVDPYLAVPHLDWTGWNVIGPEVERAATRKVEAGVMPMACQDPVLHAAPIERKTHVRAAVVEREDVSAVVKYQNRGMAAMCHETPLVFQFGQASHVHEVRGRRIHWTVPRSSHFRRV